MALGVYSLLTHPEQLRLLQQDGSRVKNAVEEMLRFHSIVQRFPLRAGGPEELPARRSARAKA
ncbi:MAG TPA: hypothetical protein VLK85_28530 [Ramlibacter sp.]|nr:hypothetical protein [Ramlibacter sp.]